MPFDGTPEKRSDLEIIIERAQDVLEREGWRTGCTGYRGLAKCLMGAIFCADSAGVGLSFVSARMAAYPMLALALNAEAIARGVDNLTNESWGAAVIWNDQRCHNASNAIDFLEKVKARVKEMENAV